MYIFYDEADGQVQAIYSGDTNSSAWSLFTKIEVTDQAHIDDINQYGRDCQVTVSEGAVTAVTPADHSDDHSLAKHKTIRKAQVDAKTKELMCCKYCDFGWSKAQTDCETLVDGGQTLKTNIDAAADQSALDAIVDERA